MANLEKIVDELKGFEAACAAIEMVSLRRKLGERTSRQGGPA